MISLTELTDYCDQFLCADPIQDYCPNGLQVQGRGVIHKIVTGVTASQALIDAAINAQADAILVHHGFFWKGESLELTGIRYQRIKSLIQHDIALLAYHLPLDIHPTLGNNPLFGQALGFAPDAIHYSRAGGLDTLMASAVFEKSLTTDELIQKLSLILGRTPLHISADLKTENRIKQNNRNIQSIAWCTGAAQDFIVEAASLGVDAFISGEVSERTFHLAKELNIDYFSAGHHATERFGIKALGEYLAEHFRLDHEFIDIINPI